MRRVTPIPTADRIIRSRWHVTGSSKGGADNESKQQQATTQHRVTP